MFVEMIITNNGKPIALLTPIEENDVANFISSSSASSYYESEFFVEFDKKIKKFKTEFQKLG